MKSLGLISQILTVGLSVAIAMLYIRPAFEEIDTTQTDIDRYRTELQKIQAVNATLSRHVATLASISPDSIDKLATYMPRFVDDIAVMRDLQFIVDRTGMIFKTVDYNGINDSVFEGEDESADLVMPTPHEFTLVAEGTYAQVKDLFSLLEQNQYPLEVHTASVSPLDGGFLSVDMTIITYEDTLVTLPGSN